MSSERKSGQAFLDHEIFTKSHRLDFHSGKTVDQPVPRREPRDSPRTASTGETPLEKIGGGGTEIILAVKKCLSGVLCSSDLLLYFCQLWERFHSYRLCLDVNLALVHHC